jgi:hypothetical protein
MSTSGTPAKVNLDQLAKEKGLGVEGAHDVAKDREKARRRLAYGLLILLSAVSLALLIANFANWTDLNTTKDLATAILAPIVVLVGTALGFYFGGGQS